MTAASRISARKQSHVVTTAALRSDDESTATRTGEDGIVAAFGKLKAAVVEVRGTVVPLTIVGSNDVDETTTSGGGTTTIPPTAVDAAAPPPLLLLLLRVKPAAVVTEVRVSKNVRLAAARK